MLFKWESVRAVIDGCGRPDVKHLIVLRKIQFYKRIKLGQRRASRGFSGISDVKNSALSSNYGTTRRWSSSGV